MGDLSDFERKAVRAIGRVLFGPRWAAAFDELFGRDNAWQKGTS